LKRISSGLGTVFRIILKAFLIIAYPPEGLALCISLHRTEFFFLITLYSKRFIYITEGGKEFRFSIDKSDIVFEMCTGLIVRSQNSPAVGKLLDPLSSEIYHWF